MFTVDSYILYEGRILFKRSSSSLRARADEVLLIGTSPSEDDTASELEFEPEREFIVLDTTRDLQSIEIPRAVVLQDLSPTGH